MGVVEDVQVGDVVVEWVGMALVVSMLQVVQGDVVVQVGNVGEV